ncbi:excisionase family DNA-binding protein [Ponticaulis sp.]|uniref:excisionase family DNA-binding protein n=1 Tax=Ponticaulis sp. TaxID=2020902 RepID=UPI000C5443FC|nr:excisionase family DNA-binding protein [Ponticaulis sp.]MAJ10597.1 DNA-binding protein [Ponticaulis sp.]HBH88653.1 DNA-binding protein [Hyphomonadaceae bacterium]HBJ92443.1 DNA-binding protein [Hyphomonadaceae bacterium]|tara:strand:- start:12373 stop:12882 length:510 start_codon:yes stop_codon:yes gene_type:complete
MTTSASAVAFGDSIPTEQTIRGAKELRDNLVRIPLENGKRTLFVTKSGDDEPKEIVLSERLSNLLVNMLDHLASGDGVTFVPIHKHLTTQQAADILNVSRPYLIKLLDQGEMEFETVGRHRRILAKNLFDYKNKRAATRSAALSELMGADETDAFDEDGIEIPFDKLSE